MREFDFERQSLKGNGLLCIFGYRIFNTLSKGLCYASKSFMIPTNGQPLQMSFIAQFEKAI